MRTTWRRLPFPLLLAALLPRCVLPLPAEFVDATLEELEGPGMEVQLLSTSRGVLRLQHDSIKGREAVCLEYKRGKARLNGVEMQVLTTGRGAFELICDEPAWLFDAPPETEAVSEFEITDDTGQLLFGVLSLAAKRSVAVPANHPPIVPGGPLTLAWSPATDQLTQVKVDIEYDSVLPPHVAARNGRIGFVVPPTVSTGPQELVLDMFVHPGTAHCEPDPDACRTTFLPDELLSETTFVDVTVQ